MEPARTNTEKDGQLWGGNCCKQNCTQYGLKTKLHKL